MDGMRARVLVVDDDPALAEMLTIVLRGEGFDTAVVRDGSKALDAFREVHPDLVLLDLMLPGLSGLDVCKEIRAESGIPIIMLTAKTRHRRRRARPGVRRRRLRDEAVQAEGADRPDPGPAAPGRRRVGRAAAGRRRRGRRPRPPGDPGRRTDLADPARIRPAGGAGPQAAPGVHPRGAAGTGLGLPARRRHPAGQRACAAAAVARSRRTPSTPRWSSRSAASGIGPARRDRRAGARCSRREQRIARPAPRSAPPRRPRRRHRPQRQCAGLLAGGRRSRVGASGAARCWSGSSC